MNSAFGGPNQFLFIYKEAQRCQDIVQMSLFGFWYMILMPSLKWSRSSINSTSNKALLRDITCCRFLPVHIKPSFLQDARKPQACLELMFPLSFLLLFLPLSKLLITHYFLSSFCKHSYDPFLSLLHLTVFLPLSPENPVFIFKLISNWALSITATHTKFIHCALFVNDACTFQQYVPFLLHPQYISR